MRNGEARFISRMREKFSQLVQKAFPNLPFDKFHPPEKFVGLIQVEGQRPIALFIKSNQPVAYDELIIT